MKDEHRPVHQLEHAEPTVIHHPEEDMTVLARWLQRGMEQGARFWFLLGGVVAALVAVAVLLSGVVAGKSATSQAWLDLVPAKTAEDQLKVAEANPKSPVADWARLRAAFEEYDNGLVDLTTPGKKETAGPRLKKALELFQQVAAEAPRDSSQALGATFGVARTMEARNELPEAIEQYRLVATTFPNTPEAKQSLAMAKALEDPENVQFYKELYAYKPPANPGPGNLGISPPGPRPPAPRSPASPGSASRWARPAARSCRISHLRPASTRRRLRPAPSRPPRPPRRPSSRPRRRPPRPRRRRRSPPRPRASCPPTRSRRRSERTPIPPRSAKGRGRRARSRPPWVLAS